MKTKNTLINYTTEIEFEKTISEIVVILHDKDARNVWVEKDCTTKQPVAIRFSFPFPGLAHQFIDYKIEASWRGALDAMKKKSDIAPRYQNEAQAKRTAWRTIKYMIEMLIGMAEMNQGELEQLFFSHAIDGKSERFLFSEITDFKRKQLIGDTASGATEEKQQ